MRTFYIFKINKDYSKIARDIPSTLYSAYLNIKMSTTNNLNQLYNEYFSLTEILPKKDLNSFIFSNFKQKDGYSIYKNKHVFNNYYTDESSKLIINNSYMILKSNVPNSTFLSFISKIPNIFIIDFDNNDYFWLANYRNLRLV